MRGSAGVLHVTVQSGGGNAPIRFSGVGGETWGAAGLGGDDMTVVQFEVSGQRATWTGPLTNTTTGETGTATITIDCGGGM